MLQNWKAYISKEEKLGAILWRWIKISLYILFVLSFLFVSYSAFFYFDGEYSWRCLDCNQKSITRPFAGKKSISPSTPTNISHIVFAIGGSARTWQRRRGYSELWWRPDQMRGHVWLDEEPRDPWPTTCPPYRVSDNASRFGNRASASRIARIVAESYRLGMEDVRWFVMGDDDTVFFPENLVAVLGKYDHEEMYYVGAPSESVEQDVMHSYGMAFGGGGFAISYAAAAEIAGVIDGCLERYSRLYGSDQRIQACLSELGVPLTREPGFHQVDLRGDTYGMLAAHPIAPLVSLHHLDYVKPISPHGPTQFDALRSLASASRADPARTLQQTFCYERDRAFNWSVSVSWGYTVQLYPWVLPPVELEVPLRTFQTWRSFKDGPFVFNTRPFTPDRECERPVLFFLDRVKVWNKGPTATVTEYSRYEPEKSKGCTQPGFVAASKVGSVRVIAKKMDPNVWQTAPRRQCCETRRKRWGKSVEVRIRDCSPGEITSPP